MNKDRKKELDTLLNADQEEENKKNEDESEENGEKGEEEEKKENENKENEENAEEEDEKNKEEESEEEDENKKDKEREEPEDEEETEKDKEGDEAKKKDKWHGKSREEVIKMYEDLENKKPTETKTVDTEVQKKEDSDKKDSGSGIEVPSDEDLAKMTPKQFAEWMVSTVKNIVSDTYDTRSQMRDSVTQEIRDAKKDHPLLKTSSEYRELVLSLIDTASRKGTVISLKDACAKVDEFVGKVKGDTKVTDVEKIRLKKAKAQVERGAGAPTSHGEDKGAEERRLEQIFGTSGSKSPLGGLGV
ncbi:MAG TPA: hypothetical protein P5262_02955 [Candidatus Moranbacteria bacterium]|nr:hypothetical protein [Candidatus Moranbacteria bacterium]